MLIDVRLLLRMSVSAGTWGSSNVIQRRAAMHSRSLKTQESSLLAHHHSHPPVDSESSPSLELFPPHVRSVISSTIAIYIKSISPSPATTPSLISNVLPAPPRRYSRFPLLSAKVQHHLVLCSRCWHRPSRSLEDSSSLPYHRSIKLSATTFP